MRAVCYGNMFGARVESVLGYCGRSDCWYNLPKFPAFLHSRQFFKPLAILWINSLYLYFKKALDQKLFVQRRRQTQILDARLLVFWLTSFNEPRKPSSQEIRNFLNFLLQRLAVTARLCFILVWIKRLLSVESDSLETRLPQLRSLPLVLTFPRRVMAPSYFGTNKRRTGKRCNSKNERYKKENPSLKRRCARQKPEHRYKK